MEIFLFFIIFLITFAYWNYMLSGKNNNPKTFRYNDLFNKNKLVKHLLFAICFAIIGTIKLYSNMIQLSYFAPALFILLTKLFNPLFHILYNRNIIIVTRGSWPSRGKNGIKTLDYIIWLIIVVFSIFLPLIFDLNMFTHLISLKN